jgi:hypothetical protein
VLGDFQTLTSDMLRDDVSRVNAEQLVRAIDLAVAQYSKDRPRMVVEDVVADGGHVVQHPENAKVIFIECPIGEMPPAYLHASSWSIYQSPTGLELRFIATLLTGDTLRLTLQRSHELTAETDTIPVSDREAIASYAAAVLFDQIAAETSGDGNPTIPADTVNHAAKPENFAKRAERLRQRYYDLIGLDPKRVKGASVTVPNPLPSSVGGKRLTQRRRDL